MIFAMGPYKLLVADIDGTAVDHNSNGDEITAEHPAKIAVLAAQTQDKLISLATGRNYLWAEPVIHAFEINVPVIVNSGSRIVEPASGRVLWEKRLDVQKAKQIYDFILKNVDYANFNLGLGHRKEIAFAETTDEMFDDTIYLDIIGVTPSAASMITDFVSTLQGVASATPPSPQKLDFKNVIVTNSEGTKYNALKELQKILGVTQNETIAVGDGNNDLPLFKASGLKVAVDNAGEELKKAADLIVSSVHEYGLAEVINKYLIQQN